MGSPLLLSIRFGSISGLAEIEDRLLLTIVFPDPDNPESGLMLEELVIFSAAAVAALVFLSLLFFFLILGVPSLVSRLWSSGIMIFLG